MDKIRNTAKAWATCTASTAPSADGLVWHYDKIRRSISTPAIKDGIVYQADFSGFLHALDAKTGAPYWVHDVFAAVWGSPMLIDGKIYLGDEDGDVVIMQEGKTKKVLGEINMGSSVYSTPVPANGALYISNRNQLYALSEGAGGPKPATSRN
jgi:outer membrane protein assembly factor BamB